MALRDQARRLPRIHAKTDDESENRRFRNGEDLLLQQPLASHPRDPSLRRMRMVLLQKIGEATGRLGKENGSNALAFFLPVGQYQMEE
jgi:hypothetical protein